MSEHPNQQLMENIWSNIPKELSLPAGLKGEYIRYIATDPKYLYLTGFVDESVFSYEEWEAAFEDCKQADKTYLISKDKFLSLGKFKYVGPIKNPLDIMKVHEGWYDINRWHEFCVRSILPSTTITLEQLIQSEKNLKDQGKIVNGRIFIDKSMKLIMKSTIDNNPSPRRRRELSVHELHQKRLKAEKKKTVEGFQKSEYQKGEKLGNKQKRDLNESLLKTSQTKSHSGHQVESIDLKTIMKNRKSGPKKNV